MPERSDDEIDDLLRPEHLPPPPEPWVERAEELPRLERALSELEGRGDELSDDDAMRAALEHVGLEPDDERMRALARLMRGQRSRR